MGRSHTNCGVKDSESVGGMEEHEVRWRDMDMR